MQERAIKFTKPQIIFFFHLGFILLLPLIGTSVFNMARQLYEYSQYGFYYEECSMYYMPNFTRESFDICKNNDLLQLSFAFLVTTSIFTYIAYRIRNYIVRRNTQ